MPRNINASGNHISIINRLPEIIPMPSLSKTSRGDTDAFLLLIRMAGGRNQLR